MFLRKAKNILFHISLYLCAVIVLMPLFLIVHYLFMKGAGSLSLDFFINESKPVGEIGGGMFHAIMGTLYMVLIGSIIAIPIGIASGVYLSEYEETSISKALRISIDLLTGVPSIVIGIFAYLMIVVPFKNFSGLAGGIALSIIILPIVTRSTEEILKLVPNNIREAGLALGLPRWKVIIHIILKTNFGAITTGIMLAISRAAGETAPLLFTAFGARFYSHQLLEPMASLPVQIYNYAISPFEDWQAQAWSGSFVLIMMVLGLNLGARAIINRREIKTFFGLNKG